MSEQNNKQSSILTRKIDRRSLLTGTGKTLATAGLATTLAGAGRTASAQEVKVPDNSRRRAQMEGIVDQFLQSLVSSDPGQCPLADNVVFVENNQVMPVGDGGWHNINRLGTYRHYFCDFETNQVGLIANLFENDMGCVYVLRLRLNDAGRITEVDHWISRDPYGCAAYEQIGTPDPVWLESIPPAQRQSREALSMNAHIYFEALERNDGSGIYPFREDCERIEHARYTVSQTSNSGYGHADVATKFVTMPAKAQYEFGMMAFVTKIRDRFAPVIDVERGAVMGQGTYDFDGALTKIHFIADDVDWTIPPYFRTARSHMATEAFKVINGSFRYIEMTFLELPYGTRQHWLGKPMTVALTYEPTRPRPKPVKADTYNDLVAINDMVIDAIINDCPCDLPLADDVRYTENGVLVAPGSGGLWKTIKGRRNYSVHLADPDSGTSGWVGTLNENGLFAAVTLRIQVENGYIRTIDTIIARPELLGQRGELKAATNTMYQAPYIADVDQDAFDKPADALTRRPGRQSRETLVNAVNAYSQAYSSRNAASAPLAGNCMRRENGIDACNNPNGPVVDENKPDFRLFAQDLPGELDTGFLASITSLRDHRLQVVDTRQGLVLDLAVIDNAARNKSVDLPGAGTVNLGRSYRISWTDLHSSLFKVDRGALTYIEDLVRRVPYKQGFAT